MAHFVQEVFNSELTFSEQMDFMVCKKQFDPLDDRYVDAILSKINFFLNSTNTRFQGLIVLKLFLDDFSHEELAQHIGYWLTTSLQFLQQSSSSKDKEIALEVIIKLLTLSEHNSTVRKKIVQNIIVSILEYICTNEIFLNENTACAIKTLLTCVTYFSAFCNSKKALVENFILKNCELFDSDAKKFSAKLLAKLHLCQIPNSSSDSKKNLWFDHTLKLVVTIDSLLNVFRNNEIGFLDNQLTQQSIIPFFKQIDCYNYKNLLIIARRFEFIALTLTNMLNDCDSSPIEIPALAILNVVFKSCSIQVEQVYKRNSFLACIVSLLQKSALIILDYLIIVCKTDLVIYSKYIHQILIQMLNNSTFSETSNRVASTRYNFDLKFITYHVINIWFQSVGPNLFVGNKVSEELLYHFINDIKQPEVTIKLRNAKNENIDRKQKETCSLIKYSSLCKLASLCICALKSFLFNCNIFLSSSQFNSISNFIMEQSLSLYRSNIDEQSIYIDPSSRKKLLYILYFLARQTHSNLATPTLCIFRQALKVEKNIDIRNKCIEYITSLNMLINPRKHVNLVLSSSQKSIQEIEESEKVINENQFNEIIQQTSNDTKEILPEIANTSEKLEKNEIITSELNSDYLATSIENNINETANSEQIILIDDQNFDLEILDINKLKSNEESPPNKKLKYEENDEDCLLVLKDFVNS